MFLLDRYIGRPFTVFLKIEEYVLPCGLFVVKSLSIPLLARHGETFKAKLVERRTKLSLWCKRLL